VVGVIGVVGVGLVVGLVVGVMGVVGTGVFLPSPLPKNKAMSKFSSICRKEKGKVVLLLECEAAILVLRNRLP
jgi:hypothetical protein